MVYANAFVFGPSDFATRGGNFTTLNFSPNRTYGTEQTQVGLCSKFLVYVYD